MHLKNWTWAWDHLKSSNLSADNFKKQSNSVGRYLSLRYGQPADTAFWRMSIDGNVDVQYQVAGSQTS